MNKTYLIFRHEFTQEIKKVSFIIMTLIVPLVGLLAIGVLKLTVTSPAPAQEVVQAPPQPTEGYVGDPNIANIIIPGVFSLLLGLALMFGATSLITGLAEEKESRLIQVLFSSVSVRQLLIGKVLALGTAGLLQVLVWLISTPLLLSLASAWFGGFMSRVQIPANFLVLGLIYFILGYLLFAVLSIGVGAIVSNPREGTNLSLIYTLGSFVPLWTSSLNMFFPNSWIWAALTIFPVTAPIMTMLRLGTSVVPEWQIVASIGVLVLSIVGGLSLSIRLFRMHMLMYGKRPGLKQLAQSLKEARLEEQKASLEAAKRYAAQGAARKRTRLYFIDYLRIALAILVVVHHVSLVYGAHVEDFYYLEPPFTAPGVIDVQAFKILLIFALLNQAWFMGAFFLLAGYFAPGSYDRKGPGSFIVGKLVRLGIPLALFYFVLNPLSRLGWWLMPPALTGITSRPSWGAYSHMVGVGPLWFVILLFVFGLCYAVWRMGPQGRPARQAGVGISNHCLPAAVPRSLRRRHRRVPPQLVPHGTDRDGHRRPGGRAGGERRALSTRVQRALVLSRPDGGIDPRDGVRALAVRRVRALGLDLCGRALPGCYHTLSPLCRQREPVRRIPGPAELCGLHPAHPGHRVPGLGAAGARASGLAQVCRGIGGHRPGLLCRRRHRAQDPRPVEGSLVDYPQIT
jgi:ABC-type Na+ efflux pump permease subunit